MCAGDIRKGEFWRRRTSRFLFVFLPAEVINHSSQIYSKTIEQRRKRTKEERKREKVRHEGKVPGQPKEENGGPGRRRDERLTHLTPHTPVCLTETQIYEREGAGGRESGRRAAINSSVFA